MRVLNSKTFRRPVTESSSLGERIGALYRARLSRHPFLLFGLPFIAVMIAGSFVLTPATALRYERHDRKVQQVSQEEAFSLGLKDSTGEERIKRNPRRRIIGDEREEYYVCMQQHLVTVLLANKPFPETHGQGPGQLGTKTSGAVQGGTGWQDLSWTRRRHVCRLSE